MAWAHARSSTRARRPTTARPATTPTSADPLNPTLEEDQARWEAEDAERQQERTYRQEVATMSQEGQAAEWVRLVAVEHLWLHEADECIGIPARRHLAWADDDLPGVRTAIKSAHRHARHYALEVIDAANAGLINVRTERLASLQWRAARGDNGEWLGNQAELQPGADHQPVVIGSVTFNLQGAPVPGQPCHPFREIVEATVAPTTMEAHPS